MSPPPGAGWAVAGPPGVAEGSVPGSSEPEPESPEPEPVGLGSGAGSAPSRSGSCGPVGAPEAGSSVAGDLLGSGSAVCPHPVIIARAISTASIARRADPGTRAPGPAVSFCAWTMVALPYSGPAALAAWMNCRRDVEEVRVVYGK